MLSLGSRTESYGILNYPKHKWWLVYVYTILSHCATFRMPHNVAYVLLQYLCWPQCMLSVWLLVASCLSPSPPLHLASGWCVPWLCELTLVLLLSVRVAVMMVGPFLGPVLPNTVALLLWVVGYQEWVLPCEGSVQLVLSKLDCIFSKNCQVSHSWRSPVTLKSLNQ